MKRRMTVVWRFIRNFSWAVAVAYMLAFHNIYYEVQKFKDDIVIVVEENTEIREAAPKE